MEDNASVRTYWTSNQYNLFLEICLKATDLKKRSGKGWGAGGFQFLIDELRAHGHHFTQDQLKNKWDWMRNKWRMWDGLLKGETGLGWDEATGKIIASEEWWSEKIKENPKYEKIRQEGIDKKTYYSLLSLFRGVVANGRDAFTPSTGGFPEDIEEENESSQNLVTDVEVSLDDMFETGDFNSTKSIDIQSKNSEDQSSTRKKKKEEPTSSLSNKKAKGKNAKKNHSGAERIAQSIEDLTLVMQEKTRAMSGLFKDVPGSSIEEVMADILTLDGIEEGSEFWNFCIDLLEQDGKRKIYAGIKTTQGKLSYFSNHFKKEKGGH